MNLYITYDRYEHDEWYYIYGYGTNRSQEIKKCKEEYLPDFFKSLFDKEKQDELERQRIEQEKLEAERKSREEAREKERLEKQKLKNSPEYKKRRASYEQ
jgi:hypothetical protein